MAHFDIDEMVDCIRHNMAMLDENGLAGKILQQPRRRIPPGGLPLEMCRKEDDDQTEKIGPTSMIYQLSRGDGPSTSQQQAMIPLREHVRNQLLAKLREMEQSGRVNKAAQPYAQRPTECTLKFEPKLLQCAKETVKNRRTTDQKRAGSLTARLLSESQLEGDVETFAEFARFEAMEGSIGSKCFNILFPFAEKSNCAIQIQIIRTATITDLIGLACHVYSRRQQKPPCGPPMEYDLYLAEEDMTNFDIELPPQDRRRRVADCGFPNLAMVKRSAINRRPSQRVQSHQINIFLVDGRCYAMETDSLDISLRQVLEYGLARKKDDDEQGDGPTSTMIGSNLTFLRRLDYILEPLDQPGRPVDLNGSVSSSGTTDFVMLRMNSARGDNIGSDGIGGQGGMEKADGYSEMNRHIHSRSLEFTQLKLDIPQFPAHATGVLSKPCTPTTTNGEIDWSNKRRNRFSLRQSKSHHYQLNNSNNTSPYSMDSMATLGRRSGAELAQMMLDQSLLPDGDHPLVQFQVNRIHRFQPKTCSNLVVRHRCLELIPIQPAPTPSHAVEPMKKRAMGKDTMGKSAQAKKIPWELVAAVEVPPNSEQRPNARRIVRLIFLAGVSPSLVQHIIESGKNGKPPEHTAYEGSFWKTILLEAAAEEAWQIGVRLSELLDSRPSQVHLLYQYSAGASIKPQSAAEKAFGTTIRQSPSPSAAGMDFGGQATADRAPKKKLSMIFSRMRL